MAVFIIQSKFGIHNNKKKKGITAINDRTISVNDERKIMKKKLDKKQIWRRQNMLEMSFIDSTYASTNGPGYGSDFW
jgi:hypothetical protein